MFLLLRFLGVRRLLAALVLRRLWRLHRERRAAANR
jgi:hypothetical protein